MLLPSTREALMPHSVILGSFGGDNAGDLLVLESILGLIRSQDSSARFTIPIPRRSDASVRVAGNDIHWIQSPEYRLGLRFSGSGVRLALRTADSVILTAGIIFDERLWHPTSNFLTSLHCLIVRSRWRARLGLQRADPMWIGFGIGIPPASSYLGAKLMRRVVSSLDLVIARDARSARRAIELGLAPERVVPGVDAIWNPGMRRNDFVSNDLGRDRELQPVLRSSRSETEPGRIGLNVNRYFSPVIGRSRRGFAYKALVDWVREKGLVAEWFCTSVGDEKVAEDLNRKMTSPLAIRGLSTETHWDLMARATGYDAMVGSRLHASLLALSRGVPALAVPYRQKVTDTFESLGLGDLVVLPEDFNPSTVVPVLKRCLEEPDLHERITQARTKAEALFLRQSSKLLDVFDGPSHAQSS